MSQFIELLWGPLKFTEVSLRGYNRVAKMNGPDYLYTECELHVRGLYNPALNDNLKVVLADNKIFGHLFPPRQSLALTVNNVGWVSVQWAGADAQTGTNPDLDWGPYLLYSNIAQMVGERSAYYDLGFRFFIHEPVESMGNKLPMVLSNRWTTKNVTDHRFWTSRVVAGQAVFNPFYIGRERKGHPINNSDLQKALILPVPIGFKRGNIETSLSEDGTTVRYSFVDREVPYVALPDFVSHIEFQIDGGMLQESPDTIALKAIQAGTQAIQSGIEVAALASRGPSGLVGAGGAAATTGLGLSQTALNLWISSQPQCKLSVTCIVYGLPESEPDVLLSMAATLAILRTNSIPKFNEEANAVGQKKWYWTAMSGSVSTHERVAAYTIVVERSAVLFATEKLREKILEKAGAFNLGLFDGLTFGLFANGGAEVKRPDKAPPPKAAPKPEPAEDLETFMACLTNTKHEEGSKTNPITSSINARKPLGGALNGSSNLPNLVFAALNSGENTALDGPKVVIFDTLE